MKASMNEIATIIRKAIGDTATADLIDNLLCIEAEPRFTDREVQIGTQLFDALTEVAPECIAIAQGR
jgi:hypothetical protein